MGRNRGRLKGIHTKKSKRQRQLRKDTETFTRVSRTLGQLAVSVASNSRILENCTRMVSQNSERYWVMSYMKLAFRRTVLGRPFLNMKGECSFAPPVSAGLCKRRKSHLSLLLTALRLRKLLRYLRTSMNLSWP